MLLPTRLLVAFCVWFTFWFVGSPHVHSQLLPFAAPVVGTVYLRLPICCYPLPPLLPVCPILPRVLTLPTFQPLPLPICYGHALTCVRLRPLPYGSGGLITFTFDTATARFDSSHTATLRIHVLVPVYSGPHCLPRLPSPITFTHLHTTPHFTPLTGYARLLRLLPLPFP